MLLALFWEFLKQTTFLLILLLFIGCPLIHEHSTNSLLSVIIASTRLLLAIWLNSWESISQPANFAHLLILPFYVFPLYAYTRLVKGHFLILCRQSGTLSLTKSGHPTPSHPSDHHFKVIFSTVLLIVWVRGGRDGGRRERERERERERDRQTDRQTERELVNYRKVSKVFCLLFVYLFCFM